MKAYSKKDDIKKISDEALALLTELIKIPTVNPPGNEIRLKPIVKKAFDDLGMTMKIVEKEKGRANFIGRIGSGKPTIGFFPHLDTVPAGDGWKTDPFTPVIKKGKMYGRGVIDSKGNFASSWAAIKLFLETHKKFKGTIYLVGCADEEMGSELGMEYLLEKGLRVDYGIVPDGGFMDQIVIGEKGVVRLLIKSFGKQAHGSTPQDGINAIEHIMKVLLAIQMLDLSSLSYHKRFDGITINIGVIKGGHAANMVPAYAEAEIDIRLPLGVDKKDVVKLIRETIREYKKNNHKAKFILEETLHHKPHITEEDTTLISSFLMSAIELKLPMKVGTMGGITDAKSLSLYGMQTVVHFMDDGTNVAHGANEYLLLSNFSKTVKLYCKLLEKLLL